MEAEIGRSPPRASGFKTGASGLRFSVGQSRYVESISLSSEWFCENGPVRMEGEGIPCLEVSLDVASIAQSLEEKGE